MGFQMVLAKGERTKVSEKTAEKTGMMAFDGVVGYGGMEKAG